MLLLNTQSFIVIISHVFHNSPLNFYLCIGGCYDLPALLQQVFSSCSEEAIATRIIVPFCIVKKFAAFVLVWKELLLGPSDLIVCTCTFLSHAIQRRHRHK